jgi:hypothetical protein
MLSLFESLMSEKTLPAARPITRFAGDMPGPRRREEQGLKLSVIVVAYAMPEQLDRTLYSLSLDYQHSVVNADYEVIVVENTSERNLGEARATAHRGQFRYFEREEAEPTPIHAINFGAEQAKGDFVAIMIDGARMITPGVVAWTLAGLNLYDESVICVPGYHLGSELQQIAARKGYNEDDEARLLASIGWPEDGYRLFDISCSAGTSAGGFFKPIGESNCIAMSRALFHQLGGFDAAFRQRGGGLVNMDFYKRALETKDTQLVILPGEGSFHQFHKGETTGKPDINRDQLLHDMQAEYVELRGERFSPPEKRATFLGPVPDSALRYLRRGAESVMVLNGLEDG